MHPNDITKRVEFATTKDGDSRIWLDGDKVVIKRNTGNVGIGTNNPQAKLEIVGNIKITDGTQGEGKILISDANGVATWGDSIDSIVKRVKGITITCSNISQYLIMGGINFYCQGNIMYGDGFYSATNNSTSVANMPIKGNQLQIPMNTNDPIQYQGPYNSNIYTTSNKVLYIGN